MNRQRFLLWRTRVLIVIIVLSWAVTIYAATLKWSAVTELTTIADNDWTLVIDTTDGTSKKITVLNLFDTIDTFAELNIITADKTLVNEEDAVTWDALGTFSAGINLGTSQALVGTTAITFGNNGQTVAINSSDWDVSATGIATGMGNITSDGTVEAATLTEGGVAVHNNDEMDASSELLAIIDDETGTGVLVFGTAPTFTTSITITGADANPVAAGEIRYDDTIAGIMSGGGIRWYDDNSVRLFVDLETDPSNDDYVVAYDSTADGFYMKADADTGGSTLYNNIGDPSASGSISFDDGETATYTGATDAAVSFFNIVNSDADHTGGNMYLLDLDYSGDDGDPDADFAKFQDSGGVVMTIEEEAKIVMTPGGVGSLNAISVTPSAAISTNEAVWNAIELDGTALDPSGDDIALCGLNVNMSGVVFGGTGGNIDGIGITMAGGEDHAIHISQGKFVAENTVAATAGAEFTIFDIQIHTASMNANSSIHAIDVATPETPAGTVVAVGTHSNVEVIQQSIGTFSTPSQTEYAGEKHTGGTVWVDGVDTSEIFVADDDEIYVGSTAQFSEIDVIMTTPGSKTVTPTFHYNTAPDTWTEYFPADDTDGFQQSGIIRWTLADISGSWTNDGDPGGADSSAGYWIKIIRTANADPGTPTPTTVKTGAITTTFWDKTGALDVISLEADTITEGGNAVWNTTETDIIDSAHYAAGSIDQEHFAVDVIGADEYADGDLGDTSFSGGASTVESMTLGDASTGTYYVGLFADDTGTARPIYADAPLSYAQATGTLTAGEFSGGGGSLTGVDAVTGDSATAFFDAGTIEHEYGGLQADISGYTGLIGITGADTTVEVDLLSELLTAIGDVTAFITDDDMPAVATDPDVDAAGEIGRDSDGANESGDSSLRGYDGTNQFLYARKIVRFSAANVIKPNDMTDATRDKCWVGHNNSGMTFTVTEILAWSDTDDTDFTVIEYDEDGASNLATVDAIQCTAGTGPYTDVETVITGATIEHGHTMWLNFDDTDAPEYVAFEIWGWYNADVD